MSVAGHRAQLLFGQRPVVPLRFFHGADTGLPEARAQESAVAGCDAAVEGSDREPSSRRVVHRVTISGTHGDDSMGDSSCTSLTLVNKRGGVAT